MRIVYNLMMIDIGSSYGEHTEAFNIGFFSSRDKAENVAKKYLNNVKGFKDHNVTYQITEKLLIGYDDSIMLSEIFIVYGWNENEDFDEINIIESDCYANKQNAEQKLNELKSKYSRKEWCIDKYIIDECNWKEGFVKEYHA